ncbi:RICIN domain-containing protein [Xanthovirga aplysinae]|uniref:RICIN domain-containing protein n=1 Tax=Xanthovirga aplysinae TaxID=2529853 RepID=UPI0012BC8826|nr:hypothetical protein [Xanthovirga aplysinae]MTI29756.1 hypothetical protein [Xanthovirga aplysinae]
MKKKIYILTLIILCSIGFLEVQGQYKTFRLKLKSTEQYLTNENGILKMEDKKTGKNGLSQLFTIKRVTDNKVWLISASDNSLYIKRTGSAVTLGTHPGGSDLEFHWEIQYAGGEYRNLAKGDATNLALHVSGSNISFAQPPKLTSLNDTSADSFRIQLEEMANTF